MGLFGAVIIAGLAARVLVDPVEPGTATHPFWDRFWAILGLGPSLWIVWRFAIRPRAAIREDGVLIVNVWRTAFLPWAAVAGSGEDGQPYVIANDQRRIGAMALRASPLSELIGSEVDRKFVELVRQNVAERGCYSPVAPYTHRIDIGLGVIVLALASWTALCLMASAAFGDPDEQQRQPAQQHVGADAGFEAVEDRPQLEGALEVTEAAFGLDRLAQCFRVRGAEVDL